jgi:hypothetical protein
MPGQNQLAVVPVRTAPSSCFDNPHTIGGGLVGGAPPGSVRQRDVAPDGKRIIAPVVAGESEGETTIHFVRPWFEELKRLVPTN